MFNFNYKELMRVSKDKKYIRLKMVQMAKERGIKETARVFGCSKNTVKKWLRRYNQDGYKGLENASTRPIHSPNQIKPEVVSEIIKLKKKFRTIGAERLKELHGINVSARTMRKYWRRAGIGYNIRKRHKTKSDLRKVKAKWKLFSRLCVDTKDLKDIPEYWEYMFKYKLPSIQYTAREVVSGLQFVSFAQERSLSNSLTFIDLIKRHLEEAGVSEEELKQMVIQTDNGSEFVGSWNAKEDSEFTRYVNKHFKGHYTIPPSASNYQADVESVHSRIEAEFYRLEEFRSIPELLSKGVIYIAWFNFLRTNSYKDNKSPWQIIQSRAPKIKRSICFFRVGLLDYIFTKNYLPISLGGQHVYTEPASIFSLHFKCILFYILKIKNYKLFETKTGNFPLLPFLKERGWLL